ncbi:hypothetical protein [Burkholderia plantarii]|nr:hypothetical protein [Burkholderia plantarii]
MKLHREPDCRAGGNEMENETSRRAPPAAGEGRDAKIQAAASTA